MFRVDCDGIYDAVWWQDCGGQLGLYVVEASFSETVLQMNRKQFNDFKDVLREFIRTDALVELKSPGKIPENNLEFMVREIKSSVVVSVFNVASKISFGIEKSEVQRLIDTMEGEK